MFVFRIDGAKVPWVHYCYLVKIVAMSGSLNSLSVLLRNYNSREISFEKKEILIRSLPIKEATSLISIQLLQFF